MSPASLSPWVRLTSIATLGTERAPLPEDVWPEASLQGSDASSERTLLRAAAATHLWQLAGRRALARDDDASPVAFPSLAAEPRVSEAAAWRLGGMLGGSDHRALVTEWLELAQAARKRLPTHWLPVVLDGLDPAEAQRFAPVLGSAAEWLAAQNPKWVLRAAREPSEQRWLDASLEERVAELALVRAVSPERAREWIERTWAEDPPEAREAFIRALEPHLGDADEALLERALDDKRKSVRLAAAECLSRLAGSAHARRNLERVDPCLGLEAGTGLLARFRKRALTVTLPAALDKSALRDGIEPKVPAQRKIGERAFWLMQMLARVAPVHWTTRFGCEPSALLASALATEYGAELLAALSLAALRHPSLAWIEALCDAQRESGSDPMLVARWLADLIRAAPVDARAGLLEAQLTQLRAGSFATLHALLVQLDTAWTPALTSLALEALLATLRADRQTYPYPRDALQVWGLRCHVGSARPLVAALHGERSDDSPWRNALERLHEIVEFRAAMQEELRA